MPEPAILAGYSALIEAYELLVPIPHRLSATGQKHRVVEKEGWRILTPRHAPEPSLEGHLIFALKYEGLDLAVLKRLFAATGPEPIAGFVKRSPTGSYARRVWFLYEWLMGHCLDLPDASRGRYFPVVDEKQQFAAKGRTSPRHRLRDNLPGTPDFCPLVFRTVELERFVAMDLSARAQDCIAALPKDILARTSAFLLLKDSKSSYIIEGERPPQDRMMRWGRAIGEAGKVRLDRDELLRLQRTVIGDARFIRLGFRTRGGFVGAHDRESRLPLPEHISARPEDLDILLSGLVSFPGSAGPAYDPVIAAAVLAFGFVYIHPFEDGNGRVHRYLIHHQLAERGFNPPGLVFPVSAVILDRLDAYHAVLESYSKRLLPLIAWEVTGDFNVHVVNDTADFYRYFDATPHAEFLYRCVQRTIEVDLPYEADFLRSYDRFREEIGNSIEMPDRLIDLLFRFLKQNDGRLSKRAREKEFAALTEDEARRIEEAYDESFTS